jgi:hypothetical protein
MTYGSDDMQGTTKVLMVCFVYRWNQRMNEIDC